MPFTHSDRRLLAVLVITTARLFEPISSLSSHSPQDLLAYPKYSVNLTDWNLAINNQTATSIINPEAQSDESRRDQLSLLSGGLSPSSSIEQDWTQYRSKLMRTSSGQAFLCKLPQIPTYSTRITTGSETTTPAGNPIQSEAKELERKVERERIESEGLKKGLELLSDLKDKCIYTRLGWFTYSFCYGKGEIRQFHAISIPGHNHPHEDPNQDVYVLGYHVEHPHNPHHQARLDGTLPISTALTVQGELTSLRKNRFSAANAGPTMGLSDVLREESISKTDSAREEEEFEEKRYVVQRWEGGTICDMTGKPRSAEVQYHCSTTAADHIALLRETSICEYLVVIHTPRLCSEPLFLDGGGRKGLDGGEDVSEIECRPVLTDEEIEILRKKELMRQQKLAEEEEARQIKLLEHEDHLASSSDQDGMTKDPQEFSEQLSKDDQSQLVLEDKIGRQETKTDESSDPETTGKQGGSQKPEPPKLLADVIEVDPITVYYDTGTGQIFMDQPNNEPVRGAGAGGTPSTGGDATNPTNGDGQPTGPVDEPNRSGGLQPPTRPAQDNAGDSLESLAKVLRESIGALLRDMRAGEEAGGRPVRVHQQPIGGNGALSDLLTVLKESKKKKQQNQKKMMNSNYKSNSDLNKRMSDEHQKLVKMYGSKLDLNNDEQESEDGKN